MSLLTSFPRGAMMAEESYTRRWGFGCELGCWLWNCVPNVPPRTGNWFNWFVWVNPPKPPHLCCYHGLGSVSLPHLSMEFSINKYLLQLRCYAMKKSKCAAYAYNFITKGLLFSSYAGQIWRPQMETSLWAFPHWLSTPFLHSLLLCCYSKFWIVQMAYWLLH